MPRDCSRRREDPKGFHNLKSPTTMEDLVRSTPRIYARLENQ